MTKETIDPLLLRFRLGPSRVFELGAVETGLFATPIFSRIGKNHLFQAGSILEKVAPSEATEGAGTRRRFCVCEAPVPASCVSLSRELWFAKIRLA